MLERHVRHRLAQVRVHLARGGEDALHARRRDRDGEVLLGYYVGMVNEVAVVRRPAPGPPSPRRGPPSPRREGYLRCDARRPRDATRRASRRIFMGEHEDSARRPRCPMSIITPRSRPGRGANFKLYVGS